MSMIKEIETEPKTTLPIEYKYLIAVKPLGLLYGSRGRFLSPDNLVGRSGTSFPPASPTLSGVFAAEYGKENPSLKNLFLAGPFWAETKELQSFFVPTPFNILVSQEEEKLLKDSKLQWHPIKDKLTWNSAEQIWAKTAPKNLGKKVQSGTWIKIKDWKRLQNWPDSSSILASASPWEELSHLHPRLEENERHVRRIEDDDNRGSLFLENAVQLNPDVSLVYLSNQPLPANGEEAPPNKEKAGWYRFGGEGHLAEISCHELAESTKNLLSEPIASQFALITPALWGSNHLSYREPKILENNEWREVWTIEALITERPTPFRYRLGGSGNNKRLSRGRYAMSAGTVYVLKEPLNSPWVEWPASWFPIEGYSFQRWGCGLALPLNF